MILYLDTSALVKLYVWEAGSAEVRGAVVEAEGVVTNLVAYAEARAAFARKATAGYVHQARKWREHFETDWCGMTAMPIDTALIRKAGDFAERHQLRGYDAVHLAAAVTAFQAGGAETRRFRFLAFDKRLNNAARARGLPTLP